MIGSTGADENVADITAYDDIALEQADNPASQRRVTARFSTTSGRVAGDADGKGVSDGWEMTHFGHLLGARVDADPDGGLRFHTTEMAPANGPAPPL